MVAASAGADKPLELIEPKDGAEVREKVKIVIPRASVPAEGFVAIYIDKQFKVALAPPSAEDLQEKKLPPNSPVTYVWDTKAPLTSDTNVTAQDRFAQDGPHVISIKSYRGDGGLVEEVAAQVTLKNILDSATNQAVPLMYGGREGEQYEVEHTVNFQADAGQTGFRAYGAPSGPASSSAGPSKLAHTETSRYLVSLEDVLAATGTGFWRERRKSPLTVVVNNLKQVVRLDTSSRYYSMDPTGTVRKSKVMERESREPILNPDRPPRPPAAHERAVQDDGADQHGRLHSRYPGAREPDGEHRSNRVAGRRAVRAHQGELPGRQCEGRSQ